MKLKLWLLLLPLLGMSVAVSAQSSLPRKVSDVTLLDLNGDPTQLPYWGEKNLMIFYIDPDHHKQNEDFTTDMEENHRVEGENLFGFGVMNLKDAPMIPNGMAPNMANAQPPTALRYWPIKTIPCAMPGNWATATICSSCCWSARRATWCLCARVLSPMPIKKSFIKSYRSTDKTSPCRNS